MALLKYIKASKDSLPNPKGSLSSAIPSRAIAQANHKDGRQKHRLLK